MRHESALLSLVGWAVGLLIGTFGGRTFLGMLTVNAGPIALTVAPDWRMLLTTGAIACAATVMSSLLPAIFLQTTVNLDRVDPGFNPDRLVSFRVEPALSGYDRAHSEPTHARIMDRTGAVPGVTSVSMLSVPLLAGRALSRVE